MNPQLHDSTEHFRVSVPEADLRISRWQDENYMLVPKKFDGKIPEGCRPLELDSFSLSVEDLLHLTERIKTYNQHKSGTDHSPISGFACRLGIKDYLNVNGEKEPLPCLLIEPLLDFERNDDPHDPIALKSGELMDRIPEEIDGKILDHSAIYDFSYPCPPTCPTKKDKKK